MTIELKSYFGIYSQKSPCRAETIKKYDLDKPGFPDWYYLRNEDINKRYLLVNENNFKKLYEALIEECQFRKIDPPACYIDIVQNEKYPIAHADPWLETIFIDIDVYDKLTKRELRALIAHEIKHLYQGQALTPHDKRLNELDSDRASIESTDFDTIKSFTQKVLTIMIDKKIKTGFIRKLAHEFNDAFPNFVVENLLFIPNAKHPSPASRIRKMKKYYEEINLRCDVRNE